MPQIRIPVLPITFVEIDCNDNNECLTRLERATSDWMDYSKKAWKKIHDQLEITKGIVNDRT